MAAGVAVAAIGTAVVAPLPAPTAATVSMPALSAPAIALTAAVQPLQQAANVTASATGAGDAIINAYNALQPWVAYGYQLVQWGLSWIPGVWLVAPAVDLAYYTAQPLIEGAVYSFAYLIDGQADLIPPTLTQAVQNSANNFVAYTVNWAYSIFPFPPLPPLPIFNGLAAAAPAPAATGRGLVSAAAALSPKTAPEAAPEVAPVVEAPAARTRVATQRPALAVARATAARVAPAAAQSFTQNTADAVSDAVAPVRAAARSGRAAQHESRR